jgi:serine protein kinase
MDAEAGTLLDLVRQKQDLAAYRERHWTGSFEDYLALAMSEPRVVRNAWQRLYDMILSYGQT